MKTIRIWDGCRAVALLTIGDGAVSLVTPESGAGNSSQVDIDFDPIAGLIVDRTVKYPTSVSIRGSACCEG